MSSYLKLHIQVDGCTKINVEIAVNTTFAQQFNTT